MDDRWTDGFELHQHNFSTEKMSEPVKTYSEEAVLILGPDHPLYGGTHIDRILQEENMDFYIHCCSLWFEEQNVA